MNMQTIKSTHYCCSAAWMLCFTCRYTGLKIDIRTYLWFNQPSKNFLIILVVFVFCHYKWYTDKCCIVVIYTELAAQAKRSESNIYFLQISTEYIPGKHILSFYQVKCCHYDGLVVCFVWNTLSFKGSITIRRTAIPSMWVNFSTFAFLLNFSIMKWRKH